MIMIIIKIVIVIFLAAHSFSFVSQNSQHMSLEMRASWKCIGVRSRPKNVNDRRFQPLPASSCETDHSQTRSQNFLTQED